MRGVTKVYDYSISSSNGIGSELKLIADGLGDMYSCDADLFCFIYDLLILR